MYLDFKAIAGDNRLEHSISRGELLQHQKVLPGQLGYGRNWEPFFSLIGSVVSVLEILFLTLSVLMENMQTD